MTPSLSAVRRLTVATRNLLKNCPGGERIVDTIRHRRSRIDPETIHQQLQTGLLTTYRQQFRHGEQPFDNIRDAGFRCSSQFEEDGIILYVLAGIGMTTRRVVEIGCGTGRENMATNLILNHGYEGFLIDGSARNVRAAVRYYQSKHDCLAVKPHIQQAWITRDNVNELLQNAGAVGEVDVLSLDIDGNDWHIWSAIDIIRPRLCVFETHDIIPDGLSLTIPYDPEFDHRHGPHPDFRSASLTAMATLSAAKGYRLIGANRHGFNAFFLRNDIAPELFPAVSVAAVHDNPWTRAGQHHRWPRVQHLNWLPV